MHVFARASIGGSNPVHELQFGPMMIELSFSALLSSNLLSLVAHTSPTFSLFVPASSYVASECCIY
jgi:hypothetical protein